VHKLAKRVQVLVLTESLPVWFEADGVNIDQAANAGLFLGAGLVGAVECEIAQGGELRLYAV